MTIINLYSYTVFLIALLARMFCNYIILRGRGGGGKKPLIFQYRICQVFKEKTWIDVFYCFPPSVDMFILFVTSAYFASTGCSVLHIDSKSGQRIDEHEILSPKNET